MVKKKLDVGYKSGILTNPVSKASILAKSSLIGLRFFDASFDFSPIKLCFAKMYLKSEYTTHIYNCPLWITSLFGLKKGNLRPDIDSFCQNSAVKNRILFHREMLLQKKGVQQRRYNRKVFKKVASKKKVPTKKIQRERYNEKCGL